MKRISCFFVCLTCALLLSGCLFKSTEELYMPPKASESYVNLQKYIDEMRGTGEYTAPISGGSTQSIQLVDLNGDGVQEAVAFFRVAADEKPLKVCVFSRVAEDEYEVAAVIEGEGTAIDSIAYENLGGTTQKELIISWRISEKVHTVVVCSMEDGVVTELMRTGYTDYLAVDMDQDNETEVLVVQNDVAGLNSRVELYDYSGGIMLLQASAPISIGTGTLQSCRSGLIRDFIPALFTTSAYGESGLVTDIFVVQDGTLKNVTYNELTEVSDETLRFYKGIGLADINEDSVLEVPKPVVMPTAYRTVGTVEEFWSIRWRQYDSEGTPWAVATTYHNVEDGWYINLPDHWLDSIALGREESLAGERGVSFYQWSETGEMGVYPFLTIYRLTGSDRSARASLEGRFTLAVDGDTIYAAKYNPEIWDAGVTEEQLCECFATIQSDWVVD